MEKINIFKKLIIFVLLLLSTSTLLLNSVACDDKEDGLTVIELNMDNYQQYITISKGTGQIGHIRKAEGCLTFAIYENVLITFSNGEEMTLNAAGQGQVQSEYDSVVVAISGKVIYRL